MPDKKASLSWASLLVPLSIPDKAFFDSSGAVIGRGHSTLSRCHFDLSLNLLIFEVEAKPCLGCHSYYLHHQV